MSFTHQSFINNELGSESGVSLASNTLRLISHVVKERNQDPKIAQFILKSGGFDLVREVLSFKDSRGQVSLSLVIFH